MNKTNARDYLRQSIAGPGYQLIQGNKNQNSVSNRVPPILILPPGMNFSDFSAQIEKAYDLNYYQNFLNIPLEDLPLTHQVHSMLLMDEGIAFALADNFVAASDMLSLCLILDNNYFYNYLLATARYNLEDYSGALKLIETAINQIRDQQEIDLELTSLAQDLNFAADFYTLYIFSLLFNSKIEQAHKIVEFALENDIISQPSILIELIKNLSFFGDESIISTLSKKALSKIEAIPLQEEKNYFLKSLHETLQEQA